MDSQLASCPSLFFQFFDGSQDWVIVDNDAVAGSSPASGSKCRSSSVVEHVKSQFVSYPSVFQRAVDRGLSGPGSGGSIPPRGPFRGWCKGSTPGNSTVTFLSAFDLMGRSCGLSRVVGASPIPGNFRGSSMDRAASVRSNSMASLAHLQFHHGAAAMNQPQHSNQEAVWHTISTNMKTLISKSPASVAKGSHPKRRPSGFLQQCAAGNSLNGRRWSAMKLEHYHSWRRKPPARRQIFSTPHLLPPLPRATILR